MRLSRITPPFRIVPRGRPIQGTVRLQSQKKGDEINREITGTLFVKGKKALAVLRCIMCINGRLSEVQDCKIV